MPSSVPPMFADDGASYAPSSSIQPPHPASVHENARVHGESSSSANDADGTSVD